MSWEDGYFICPNKILKDTRIKDYSVRVLLFIHSWHYEPDKRFSVRFVAEQLTIGRKQAHEALRRLCKLEYLVMVESNDPSTNKGNLYKSNLQLIVELGKKRMKEVVRPKEGVYSDRVQGCTPIEYRGVLPESTILNNKKLSLNNNIYRGLVDPDTRILDLFDFWNEQKIVRYGPTKNQYELVVKALAKAENKHFELEDHFKAIKRYGEVLNSDLHFIDYKWNLQEFLTRNNSKKYYNPDFNSDDYLKTEYKNKQADFKQNTLRFLEGGKND